MRAPAQTSTLPPLRQSLLLANRTPTERRLSLPPKLKAGTKRSVSQLSAEVAKSGNDRRLSFKLPDGSDLVYLEKAGVQYGIAPARKQYAELTPEATGFQLQRLMTPGQLVPYLERLRGIEFVGEEPLAGRTALKYRYARTAQTQTSAGEVKTESFVYVDKDTGLPLACGTFQRGQW